MSKCINVFPRNKALEQKKVGTDLYNEAGVYQELRERTLRNPNEGMMIMGCLASNEEKEFVDTEYLNFIERLEARTCSLEFICKADFGVEKKNINVPSTAPQNVIIEDFAHKGKVLDLKWEHHDKPIEPQVDPIVADAAMKRLMGRVGKKVEPEPMPERKYLEGPTRVGRRERMYGYEGRRTVEKTFNNIADLSTRENLNRLLKAQRKWENEAPITPIRSLVFLCHEQENELKFLPDYRAAQPDVDCYILHDEWWYQHGVTVEGDADTWEEQFPVMGSCELPEPEVLVDRFLNQGSINVFAGPPETYKTMALIELSAAILEGRKAFNEFQVMKSYPILFLQQDMDLATFQKYARPFGLMKQQQFRWQRPGTAIMKVVDAVLQKAVAGKILILDTMLDYAQIEEANQSKEWVVFMEQLRDLIRLHGCIAILMTAHSNKTGAKATNIDPSDYFKDSVTFAGKVDVGYGFKPITDTCQIQIERIKQRGFEKGLVFTIAVNDDDGESNLSRGCFPAYKKPGVAKKLKGSMGRPAKRDPELIEKVKALKAEGKSSREIAEAVEIGETTVRRILQETEFDFNKENEHERTT